MSFDPKDSMPEDAVAGTTEPVEPCTFANIPDNFGNLRSALEFRESARFKAILVEIQKFAALCDEEPPESYDPKAISEAMSKYFATKDETDFQKDMSTMTLENFKNMNLTVKKIETDDKLMKSDIEEAAKLKTLKQEFFKIRENNYLDSPVLQSKVEKQASALQKEVPSPEAQKPYESLPGPAPSECDTTIKVPTRKQSDTPDLSATQIAEKIGELFGQLSDQGLSNGSGGVDAKTYIVTLNKSKQNEQPVNCIIQPIDAKPLNSHKLILPCTQPLSLTTETNICLTRGADESYPLIKNNSNKPAINIYLPPTANEFYKTDLSSQRQQREARLLESNKPSTSSSNKSITPPKWLASHYLPLPPIN